MRKIIILLALLYTQWGIMAQKTGRLVSVKGYYIVLYSKKEVAAGYAQKVKKEKNQSYSFSLDHGRTSMFIYTQVGNKTYFDRNLLADKFLPGAEQSPAPADQDPDTLCLFVNRHNRDLLKSLKLVTADVSKAICMLDAGLRFSPYYEIGTLKDSLATCVYIEGQARYRKLQEVEKKEQNYLLNVCQIPKKSGDIDFSLLKKLTATHLTWIFRK